RKVWIGHGLSANGRWMHLVASGWLVWELTGSTAMLGLNAFAHTFPTVIFSLIAGAIADRVGYLRVVRSFFAVMSILATLFALLTFSGLINIQILITLSALLGSAQALATPGQVSLVNQLVPEKDLAPAIALNSATFNLSRFMGPAIAGFVILWFNIATVMGLYAITLFAFSAILATVRTPDSPAPKGHSSGLLSDLAESFRYAFANKAVLFILAMLFTTGLFIRPYIDLLPGFAAQVFGRGPEGLSVLMSFTGLGAMSAALWLARRGRTKGLTRIVALSLLGSGTALLAFVLTDLLAVGALIIVFTGFFVIAATISTQTLIQSAVEPRIRARVIGLFILLSWGSPALGALVMGWASAFLGLGPVVGAGAVLTLVAWAIARPWIGKMEQVLEVPSGGNSGLHK
ncbi:MAG: MFS transporter, partial [Rhodospirillales bacterium]|nr:MFS transporter [Rhodospirillales bacterium]